MSKSITPMLKAYRKLHFAKNKTKTIQNIILKPNGNKIGNLSNVSIYIYAKLKLLTNCKLQGE